MGKDSVVLERESEMDLGPFEIDRRRSIKEGKHEAHIPFLTLLYFPFHDANICWGSVEQTQLAFSHKPHIQMSSRQGGKVKPLKVVLKDSNEDYQS